jgi:hypothetical protein
VHPDNIGAQFANMHYHDGETHKFTDEEMQNTKYYIGNRAKGAVRMSDEEGQAYNRRMRALGDYAGKFAGTIGNEKALTQHIHQNAVYRRQGTRPDAEPIKIGELRHSAPASRREEIMSTGIVPHVTDKVGSDKFTSKRYGVFMANRYTSGEAGTGADVYRLNVPHHELKVDSEYTPHGENLYIERTVQPHEVEHLGHFGEDRSLHPGFHENCATCPELKSAREAWYAKNLAERQKPAAASSEHPPVEDIAAGKA